MPRINGRYSPLRGGENSRRRVERQALQARLDFQQRLAVGDVDVAGHDKHGRPYERGSLVHRAQLIKSDFKAMPLLLAILTMIYFPLHLAWQHFHGHDRVPVVAGRSIKERASAWEQGYEDDGVWEQAGATDDDAVRRCEADAESPVRIDIDTTISFVGAGREAFLQGCAAGLGPPTSNPYGPAD